MKYKFSILLLTIILHNPLYAWENKETHPAITNNGILVSIADSYLKTQMGLTNGATTQLYWNFSQDIKMRIDKGAANPNQTTRNISEWLRVGSIIEDEDGRLIPIRSRHHFYAPIANPGVIPPNPNVGLDNKTDHPDWDAKGELI